MSSFLAFLALSVIVIVTPILRRPRIRRTLDAVMGTILIALGLRLATEQR